MRTRPLLLLAVIALAAAGCGDDGDPGAGEPEGKAISLLFALSAQSGTLAPAGAADRFTLTLRDVGPRVTVFSDRPQRQTFSEEPAAFLATWDKRFGSDPPNAALDLLVGGAASKGQGAVVLELTKPRLSGATLRFDARRVESAEGGLSHYAERLAPDPPRRFGEASLFIDDVDEAPVYCAITGYGGQLTQIVVSYEECVTLRGDPVRDA